ncbi:lipocalin family protein [Antarctobacter heliothermus]|uniref:Apolipoprotein D and lipocalin family protein n=1 Tax=Antarctobacter heliothermus TaxID=74033 RepID=A0A239EE85_9RHOB|nr:lipocalin family protein [Antarctobacter heliothermus]SNS42751.1 apolipoprotein D and lipocalin family protein [Antarctobacter heliothermus]
MRLIAVLLLAGCAAAPDTTKLPLRNPTAPVASQTDAALGRLAGDWRVVQAAGIAPGAQLRFGADQAVLAGQAVALSDQGRGRLLLGDRPVWIYWIDADNRTVAMGDPDGQRVWIMDRTGRPGERLRIAREILQWYGYDLTRLEAT